MSFELKHVELSKYLNDDRALEDVIQEICTQQHLHPRDTISLTTEDYLTQLLSLLRTKHTAGETREEDMTELERLYQQRTARVASIVKYVIDKQLINDDNPAVDLFSFDTFRERLEELQEAFKECTINHALAVKANPIRGVLQEAKARGFGAECASYPEAKHSLALGFSPRKVVFDTPCKTHSELKDIIESGCYINLDNVEEIDKVNYVLKTLNLEPSNYCKQFGLRINPVVGGGTIASTSTATAGSKFGLALTEKTKDALLRIYKENPWLQGVHVHVGSQGIALDQLVLGAERVVDFARLVNESVGRAQISVIDIGGGMSTVYDGLQESISFHDYASKLKAAVPALFSGKYDLITEFGRSVFVKSGITVSKVEAVKHWNHQPIAVLHIGANQFLRTAYLPEQWKHVLSVFTSDGTPKTGPLIRQDIAGPLCFSGDYIAKGVLIPEVCTGDYVVIHDTGGYTTSMYSKYNSRRASAIFSYEQRSSSAFTLRLLKSRETWAEAVAFWGVEAPRVV